MQGNVTTLMPIFETSCEDSNVVMHLDFVCFIVGVSKDVTRVHNIILFYHIYILSVCKNTNFKIINKQIISIFKINN